MDISNKDEFRRYTFTATMDRNAAKTEDNTRTTKGRPFLMKADAMKADMEVVRARKGVDNYDA